MHTGAPYLGLQISMADTFPMEYIKPLQNLSRYLGCDFSGPLPVCCHVCAQVPVFNMYMARSVPYLPENSTNRWLYGVAPVASEAIPSGLVTRREGILTSAKVIKANSSCEKTVCITTCRSIHLTTLS